LIKFENVVIICKVVSLLLKLGARVRGQMKIHASRRALAEKGDRRHSHFVAMSDTPCFDRNF